MAQRKGLGLPLSKAPNNDDAPDLCVFTAGVKVRLNAEVQLANDDVSLLYSVMFSECLCFCS